MNSANITSDEEKPYRDFGRVLQDLRKKLGLNQKEMAEKLEVTHGYYGHWEQGRHRPSPKVLSRIASRYDLSQFKLDLSYLMEKAGYDEEEITKAVEENGRRRIIFAQESNRDNNIVHSNAQEKEADICDKSGGEQQILPTLRTAGLKNEQEDSVEKQLDARLEWALSCISQDPTYILPNNIEIADFPSSYKVFVVLKYQSETHRYLLTDEEKETLSRLMPPW